MRHLILISTAILFSTSCTSAYVTREGPPLSDAGVDGSTPAESPSQPGGPSSDASSGDGIYFTACLSTLGASNIRNVLRFYTKATFNPGIVGGTLKLTLTPLKVGPNRTPPATVSSSETVGDPVVVRTTTNSAGGYEAWVGTMRIPGEANPLSGRDIVIENTALPGRFSTDKFCSQLSGRVVEPTDIQLEGEKNTCIYVRVNDGDPTPEITFADFPTVCALE